MISSQPKSAIIINLRNNQFCFIFHHFRACKLRELHARVFMLLAESWAGGSEKLCSLFAIFLSLFYHVYKSLQFTSVIHLVSGYAVNISFLTFGALIWINYVSCANMTLTCDQCHFWNMKERQLKYFFSNWREFDL